MIKQTTFIWLIGVFFISIIFCSCTFLQKENKETDSSQEGLNSELINSPRDSVFYLLPSPGEILERTKSSSIQYNSRLLNPVENMDKYIDSKAQSLNLGVYITDMAYSALCKRSSETIGFLEAIKTLSNEVGISTSVFESLIERAQNNSGNMDSLGNISNEAFTNMMEFLESGGKDNTLAIVSAGAYIESLYLILNSIDQYSEDDAILNLVSEIKYPLENLTEMSVKYEDDTNVNSVITYINQISLILDELDSSSSKTVITKDQNGLISILGGEKLNLSNENFISLKDKIIEIRNNIVTY